MKEIFQTINNQANYHLMVLYHPFANFNEAVPGKLNNIWLIGEIHLCMNKIINKQSNLGK
jgi:hypothetical protein